MKILTGSQVSCLSNKWDYLWIYGIFHCVRCNLNRSGADLEIFYNTLGFVWIFFSSGFVLVWLFKTWYIIGVTFCTASCILKCHLCVCMCACMCLCCLELLNTNALYHHSPWGGSFVGLCQNSLLFYFFFLLCTKNFSGLDFHSTGRTLFRRTGCMSEELRCTSSLFLTPTQKPFQKPQKKSFAGKV